MAVGGAALVAAGLCAVVALARQVPGGDLQLVQVRPAAGTFYSLQKIVDGVPEPPLPFDPFPELDLYLTSSNTFIYNDLEIDYAALSQQGAMPAPSSATDASVPPPPGDGGGGSGGDSGGGSQPAPYDYSQGTWLLPPVVQGSTVTLTVTNGAGQTWEVFATTNFNLDVPGLNQTNWAWLGRIPAGQSVFQAARLSDGECFYRLGDAGADPDGDGLSTAYEVLVSHTNPYVYDALSSDGQGTPDAWYLAQGINPLTPGVAGQDANQDGLLNWQEYLYGTDPQAPAVFAVWVGSPGGFSGIP